MLHKYFYNFIDAIEKVECLIFKSQGMKKLQVHIELLLSTWSKSSHESDNVYILYPGWWLPKRADDPSEAEASPGPWFNIKMSSYQYRKSHCRDKRVVISSYLQNGISYTGKMLFLNWIRDEVPCVNWPSAAVRPAWPYLNKKTILSGIEISL